MAPGDSFHFRVQRGLGPWSSTLAATTKGIRTGKCVFKRRQCNETRLSDRAPVPVARPRSSWPLTKASDGWATVQRKLRQTHAAPSAPLAWRSMAPDRPAPQHTGAERAAYPAPSHRRREVGLPLHTCALWDGSVAHLAGAMQRLRKGNVVAAAPVRGGAVLCVSA